MGTYAENASASITEEGAIWLRYFGEATLIPNSGILFSILIFDVRVEHAF